VFFTLLQNVARENLHYTVEIFFKTRLEIHLLPQKNEGKRKKQMSFSCTAVEDIFETVFHSS
jgi:hypothetical protein